MYERLGLGITLDFDDRASAKVRNLVTNFDTLIQTSGKMVKSFNQGVSSLHFEGLTVAGFALERLAIQMTMYGQKIVKGFVAMGKAVIDTGSIFERYRNIFEVFYKSKALAEKKMQWAFDYAAKTPFEINDVMNALKSMKAIGVEVDKTFTTVTGKTKTLMDALGDLAVLAPPEQGIKGMMIGIRNLYGGMERSFMQRMDIKPSQILGHAMGKTTEEVTASLIELSEKLAPDMMKKLFGTWTQTVSNFSDQWTRLLYTLSSNGAFDMAKKSLLHLYLIINSIRGEELMEMGKNLSSVFEFLWKPVDLLSKVVGKLILGFKELSNNYPWLAKIIAGVALSSGVFLIGAGAILKWAGMLLMAVAAIATFYVNIVVFRAQTELFNTAMLRSLKYIGMFVRGFILSGFLLGTAIYAYEKNLFGFKDAVLDVTANVREAWSQAWNLLFGKDYSQRSLSLINTEGLTRQFAKIISLGRLMKILFTQDLGDKVFFTQRQKMDFQALGLWNLAKLMVQLKGAVKALVRGFVEGFGIITGVLQGFISLFLAPLRAVFEGINKVIEKLTGKKSLFGIAIGSDGHIKDFEALGSAIGKVLGLLVGFKIVKSLFTTVASPFRLLFTLFTQLGEKIKWSGGMFSKAFGKTKNPFYYDSALGGNKYKKSNSIIDLMDADEEANHRVFYGGNPLERRRQQKLLYKSVTDLKRMQMAQTGGYEAGSIYSFLGMNQKKNIKKKFGDNKEAYDAYLKPLLANQVYNDPTQGFLSKLFMGKKYNTFGEDFIDINGQKIKVPKVRSFYNRGLLTDSLDRFSGKDMQRRDLDGNMYGVDEKYHKGVVKDTFKTLGVAGVDKSVNWLRYNNLEIGQRTRADRLRKTINTMRERGNTKQLPGIESQLNKLLPVFSLLDTVSNVKGFAKDKYGFVKGKVGDVKDSVFSAIAGSRPGRAVSFLGRGIGSGVGGASDWLNERTGVNLREMPKRFKELAPKGAWGLTKGIAKGTVGGIGKVARGAGILGGMALGALPYVGALFAVGQGIYSKLSGGKKGDAGVAEFNKNIDNMTAKLKSNGPQMAREFWGKFKENGGKIWSSLKELAIASFKALISSGVLEQMWEGLKGGAKLAWTWIQTKGITYLGLAFKWVLTDGIPLVLKGLGKLLLWFVTDLIPFVGKCFITIAGTILKVLKDAVLGGIEAGINLAKSVVPDWMIKMFGGDVSTGKVIGGYDPTAKIKNYGKGVSASGTGGGGLGGTLGDTNVREVSPIALPQFNHKGLWLNPNEQVSVIRKDETVLPPTIARKLNVALANGGLGGGINVDKLEISIKADKLSASDARQQAILILKELNKLGNEDRLRKGNTSLSFA